VASSTAGGEHEIPLLGEDLARLAAFTGGEKAGQGAR
jgi:hypothetical protein